MDFFFTVSQGASLQTWRNRPQISKGKRKSRIIAYICLGLLWVSFLWCDKRTNIFTGQFWQWPTRTLIVSKSMDEQASQHTFKKRILSVLFVFGYFNACWNVPLYFTSDRPNSRRKDGLLFSSPFAWCCGSSCTVFGPNLLRKAVRVVGTQEGITGTKRSQE